MKHSVAFDAPGAAWWPPSAFRGGTSRDERPGLRESPERQVDILEKSAVKLVEGKPCAMGLKPSMGYSSCRATNGTSCLTGASLV